jgi:transposase
MRYELSDDEWTAIKPMLPNKPRGVARPASMAQRRRCEGVLDMAPTILILTRS